MLTKIKEKKGSVFAISYIGIVMAIFLTALIVDYGSAFTYKVQLQHMTDAAVLAGADASKSQMDHPQLGPIAFFLDDVARAEINRLMNINQGFLPEHVKTTRPRINPSGEFGKSAEDQFYQGYLTVRWRGQITPHYLSFFGVQTRLQFPSRASAQAQVVNVRTVMTPGFLFAPPPLYTGIVFQ